MANINYTATADLKAYSTWLTNNVDQNASTWDSTTGEGVLVLNSGVTSIGNNAFQQCGSLLKIYIGEGITSIGDSAFINSTLTYAELPSTLTNIGHTTFWSNIYLKLVRCKALTPPIMSTTSNFSGNQILYVEPSAVNDYKNSSQWSSRFPTILPWNGYGVITYESSVDLSNYSQWLTNNVFSSTYDSTTHIGVITILPYEIGGSAFSNCTSLISIDISNILVISSGAFQSCSNLTSITFDTTLTTIHENAFYRCSSLLTFTLPNSLNYIHKNSFTNTAWWNSLSDTIIYKDNICFGYKSTKPTGEINILNGSTIISALAFQNCTELTSITLPNSITSINKQAFQGCTGLTSITFSESLTYIDSSAFYGCTGLTSITLPNSLISTGERAFQGCTGLTAITFGNSFTSIGSQTFNGCTGLTSITLPESLQQINQGSFQNCTSLTTIYWNAINIKSSLNYNNTFGGNTPITTVIYGLNTTNCGDYTFDSCSTLTTIVFSDSITRIGIQCFRNCTSLTEITLTKNIDTLSNFSFAGCSSLTKIYYNISNLQSYPGYNNTFGGNTPISTVIFGNDVNSITGGAGLFDSCSTLTTIVFSDSVTTIGGQAFQNCTGLTSITLPASLTTVRARAFYGCTNLTKVTCLATIPPTLEDTNFTTSGDTLYVPSLSKSAYQADSSWNYAFTNIKGIYTVTTSAGDNGTITPTTEVIEGESFTVTATPNAHYKVSHFVVDGIDVGTIDNYTFQNLDADHTIHVDFELITHTITATASNGGSISPSGSVTVNDGSNQTFTITPNAHYYISDVTVDGVSVGPVSTYTFTNVLAGHTINATFELITHTITATAYEGGAIVPSGAITVNEGENQSFDIIPLEGYGILAVFIDGTQIEPVETYTFSDVEEDHTIDAMFYTLQTAGFNRDEMLDIDYLLQDYLEQLKKRD